jgi:hypothetical protein
MGMTTVRVGARAAKNVQDVVDWLNDNVGKKSQRPHEFGAIVTLYKGDGWTAKWRRFGSGWFMDITFDDPKHATFFSLCWK